jgi:hypothetical protein
VEGLSAQWGAYAGSTHVWAELDLPARKPRLAGTPEKGT